MIVNRLDQGPLAKKYLIEDRQQPVLHILLQLRDQLQILLAQDFLQTLRDIAAVAYEFAHQVLRQFRHRLSVVYIARRQMKSQEFPLIIDDQVQLEAVEPIDRRLAALGEVSKNLVRVDAAVVTNG